MIRVDNEVEDEEGRCGCENAFRDRIRRCVIAIMSLLTNRINIMINTIDEFDQLSLNFSRMRGLGEHDSISGSKGKEVVFGSRSQEALPTRFGALTGYPVETQNLAGMALQLHFPKGTSGTPEVVLMLSR